MEAVKLLIVDDHTVVRDGLISMLGREKEFAVLGQARNGLEAVGRVKELQPDVVLMDLRMPELDGVEAMRRIRAEDPDVKFIVLTTYDSDEYIFDAIEAGAKGYLLKDTSRDELFQAIRAVHRGESLVQPGVAAKLLDRFAKLSRESAQAGRPEQLSERELEVLRLMATGAPNKEIAATPEYNAGIPAPLKNAIDWASRSDEGYRKSGISGKTIAIMGGGGRGAARAQDQLVQVLGVLGVDIVHPQVSVPQIWDKFDESGRLVDEPTKEEICDLLASLSAAVSGTWITCMQWRRQTAA